MHLCTYRGKKVLYQQSHSRSRHLVLCMPVDLSLQLHCFCMFRGLKGVGSPDNEQLDTGYKMSASCKRTFPNTT